MTSAEWQSVAPAIRQRSFFSATIANAKVLTRYRRMILDTMEGVVEEVVSPSGVRSIAYRTAGLADFKEKAQDFLVKEGLATEEDFRGNVTSVKSIASSARLQLIFNTNLEQANTLASWVSRVSDPSYLNNYPAAQFVRRPGAIIKRPRHVEAEGQIRRWDDFEFWLFQNAADIGGFDVPWGPFGFNSYMIQRPVKRAVAEKLGLVRPGERLLPPNVSAFGVTLPQKFRQGVKASLDDVPDDIAIAARRRLVERLGPQAVDSQGRPTLETVRNALAEFRRQRGIDTTGV
jgi:hypothetical protein